MQEQAARNEDAAREQEQRQAAAQALLPMDEAEAALGGKPGSTLQCFICKERFDTFFEEESEQWMLRNARIGGSGGKLMHASCVDERGVAGSDKKDAAVEAGQKRSEREDGSEEEEEQEQDHSQEQQPQVRETRASSKTKRAKKA
jgi:hypothetical protein